MYIDKASKQGITLLIQRLDRDNCIFDCSYDIFLQTPQDAECEAFMNTFRSNVEKLMERMKYVAGKGRHISSDAITQV